MPSREALMRISHLIYILTFALFGCFQTEEDPPAATSNTPTSNNCSLLADYQLEISDVLPITTTAPFEIGRWDDSEIGSDGLDLVVFEGFQNVQGLNAGNYLGHIGGLFKKWNTAVNENYIDIGANDIAQSTTNNPDHSSTSDYSGGEIEVYVKGSFDLNTSEGKWFECLDSRILALVSFEAIVLGQSANGLYNENRIVSADLIFNASDHAFAAFDVAVPQIQIYILILMQSWFMN